MPRLGNIDGMNSSTELQLQVCATIGTQHWVYDIAKAQLLQLYTPWQYRDSLHGQQLGGFISKFSGYLNFATVHYAGHEVPAYQPEKAFALFAAYLTSTMYANYIVSGDPSDTSSSGSSSASSSSTDSVSTADRVVQVISIVLIIVVVVGLAVFSYTLYKQPGLIV